MEQRFTAFISYRHQSPDQEVAKWLHTAIETYHIPAAIRKQTGIRKMGKCFRDQEELPLSPSLGDDIERALLASDWLIAVCTPRYLESRWCLRELEFFAEHKGRERILVVLADGHPSESLPELLSWRIDENGNRVPYEPLCAEARGAGMAERVKKLKVEKYRLLAPMLGVGFDDLRRRARQRRIRIIAIVAAAVVAAGAGLGAYAAANHAKNERLRLEAEEQQRIAAEQQRLAEAERLRAAENSIGEYLERAAAQTADSERIAAAGTLLEALELSEASGDMRRDELIAALRKAMYVEPFAPVARFSNQNVRLLDIAPAPDGRLAAGVENNNAVALIDLEANEVRYKVSVDNYQIMPPQFSPDGSRFLAVCDMGRLLTVWNTADGSVAFTYTSKANERYHIANAFFWDNADTVLVQDMEHFYLVSADGTEKLLYTIGDQQEWYDYDNNIMTLLSGGSLDELITIHTDDYTGTPVAYTPDRSRWLVANLGGATGTIVLDGDGNCVSPLYGMPGTFAEKYAFSDDGTTLACVSVFGFVAGWDAGSGDLLYFNFEESGGLGYSFSDPVFSPDGKYLSYVLNHTLWITDARTGDKLVQGNLAETNYTPELAYSAGGDFLFVLDQALYIIDAKGRLYSMSEADFSAPYNNVVQLADRMLVTKGDGTAYICCTPDAASMRAVDVDGTPALCDAWDPHMPPADSRFGNLIGQHELTQAFKETTALTDLAPKLWFSTDGKRAALSYADGVIELFDDPETGTVSAMLGQLTREITALAMSERYLVASDGGGRILFYDLDRGAVVDILASDALTQGFAFNAGQDRLMGLGADGCIKVYDLESAEELFTMRSAEPFTDFRFAADGSSAVGLTDSGALVAELWTEEAALLRYAKKLIGN